MTERVTIRFEPAGRTVTVPAGSTLLAAARQAGVAIDAPCGGAGTCGSCRVRATGPLRAMSADEAAALGGAGVSAGLRLACRARAEGDAVVRLPDEPGGVRVLTEGRTALEIEPPSARGIDVLGPAAGAAIDIGTTTVAVRIIDLRTGDVLAVAGGLNEQRAFGADVLSRVAHASAGGAPALQRLIATQVESLLSEAVATAGLASRDVVEAVAVGNTAMTGLFTGADVSPLGEAPYAGAPVGAATVPAHELGMTSFPSLDIHVLPGVSAFIGSDITAGLLATGLPAHAEPSLMLDLGTNGEVVLAADGEMIGASTAAGPALEGAATACGMRAEPGAVERVSLGPGGLELGVIGGGAVRGVCGSGMLDLLATLLDAGAMDVTGRLADPSDTPLVTERDGVRVVMLDAGADVRLTQHDVRALQLAIGAVRTGLDLLLAEAGRAAADVRRVHIAGGFGHHVRVASLVRVGLLPAEWAGRTVFVGNAALDGAAMALTSSGARTRAAETARRVRTLDLAAHPRFQESFLGSLQFPV